MRALQQGYEVSPEVLLRTELLAGIPLDVRGIIQDQIKDK